MYMQMEVSTRPFMVLVSFFLGYKTSRIVRKPDFCLCENKGADKLRSNCEADQYLCFHYIDSTISILNPKFQASSLLL